MIYIKLKNILIFSVLFLTFFLSSCKKSIDSGTLYKQSIESIVELKAFNNSEDISPSFGTAVFLEKDILVTNFHILSYTYLNDLRVFENISIRFYDQSDFVEVELFEYDELLDIAFLKIESFFGTPIKVGDSLKVDFGDTVYAIGNGNKSPRFEPAHGKSKGLNLYFDHYHPNRSGSEKAHVWFGMPVY